MKNKTLFKIATLNSLGVLVYIFLVSLFMNNGSKLFGQVDNELIAPIIFLLLFIFSALLTGFLILGKPIMLYIDGQKKEGIKLLFYTGVCLFVLLIIFSVIMFLLR